MKKIVPIKNTVLCRKLDNVVDTGSILYKKTSVDEYEIIDFSSDEEFPFEIGDTVMVSATGDEVECDGKPFHLFKVEHVVAKIDNK